MNILGSGSVERSSGAVETQKEYKSWYSLNTDFVFFNPGILYWNTPLNRDLISDFVNIKDIPSDQRPMRVVVNSQLYNVIDPDLGLPDPYVTLEVNGSKERFDLSRMLYCCPNVALTEGGQTTWDKLDDFITSVAFTDVRSGYYASAVRQGDLEVLDMPAIANGVFSPNRLKVATWGLYSNEYTTMWRTIYTEKEVGTYKRPTASRVASSSVVIKEGVLLLKEIR